MNFWFDLSTVLILTCLKWLNKINTQGHADSLTAPGSFYAHHQSDSWAQPAGRRAARRAEGWGWWSRSWWPLGTSWAVGSPCAGSVSESSGDTGAWRHSRWPTRCGSTLACGWWRWERLGQRGLGRSAAPPSSAAQRRLEEGEDYTCEAV